MHSPATILVVEDRPIDRQFLMTLLRYYDYQLLEAANGDEALKAAHTQHPDLVITDLSMPVMDGFELIRRLRSDPDPSLASTPVIFYTATYIADQVAPFAGRYGVVQTLPKPSEPQVILHAVENVLHAPPATARPPFPSPEQEMEDRRALVEALREKVSEQKRLLEERLRVEESIRRLNEDLEREVARRTTQLEATVRELDAFSHSVAHDLRAPLRRADGFANALLEDYLGGLDQTAQEYLHSVRASVQEMTMIVDGLLALSRVSRHDFVLMEVDLTYQASAIARELEQQDPERPVVFEVADGLVAHADPRLVRILMDNLLRNAWKFTRKVPTARIQVGSVERDGESAYFVRDNGIGFEMAHAGKLFAPFQRLHSPREFEGTGIGLATAQRIVHRHGGRIWVEASPGQGATFYFTLPPASGPLA